MRKGPPLILGYHGIGVVAPSHDPIDLYVPPEELVRQVEALQRRGYEFLRISEFAVRLEPGKPPPRGIAALTFDDGTLDHADTLPALLADLAVPGTIYVCPGLLGQPYPWTLPEAGIRFMDEPELLALARHPQIEIGAHTNEHHELHEADLATALAEMGDCKRTLETMLDLEVVSFCYPRCHYSRAAAEAAPRAGYTSAVTCGLRGSWNPYELKREVAHGRHGSLVTAMRLRGTFSGLGPSLPARLARRAALGADGLAARFAGR